MSMFTTAPNRVKKVSARTKASDRSTASNKRNGKATSKCAAFDGWRKKTAKKIMGTVHEIGKIIAANMSSGRQPVASAKEKIDNDNRLKFGVAGRTTRSRTATSKNRRPKANSSPSTALKKNCAEKARQIAAKKARTRVAPR